MSAEPAQSSAPDLAARAGLRRPGAILLLSCYELGHSPLGIASPAAFLTRAGFAPACRDLSVERLGRELAAQAEVVVIAVPMHTALRIGIEVGRKVRSVNREAVLVYTGLYAALNAAHLFQEGGADYVIGGEYEGPLVALAEALATQSGGSAAELPSLAGVATRARPVVPPLLAKLDFPLPERGRLPGLAHYAHLERDGEVVAAGYVEASRGCKHFCRHCPIPPVYGGRFFVVPAPVVLADCAAQIAAGALHITFGDPDFLNGPGHVLPIVRELNRRHPEITFDVTAKVEHLLRHRDLLPELRALGCAFVVSAVESLSDRVLTHLDKGHTRADVFAALAALRAAGLPLRPTFVAFTPWTTAADYRDLLAFVASEALIDHVDPVQYALRLLVPPGSLLATDGSLAGTLGALDPKGLSYRWAHPDPAMDRLQARLAERVSAAAERGEDPMATFYAVKALAHAELGEVMGALTAVPSFPAARERRRPPRLTEDWFC
jgi:radical SAM superfamily enzyme YgiQ (UPF0313 family)